MPHLKQGDPEPTINPEHFTLFGNRFCPFVDRVRLTMTYHKLPHDLILIDLQSKPDWYLRLYSAGLVPLLLKHGEKLIESDMIMQFIDQLYGPDQSLLKICGEKTFEKARDLAAKVFRPIFPILYVGHFDQQDQTEFRSACNEVESTLTGRYFAGDTLSLADLIFFPMLDRFDATLAYLNDIPTEQVVDLVGGEPLTADWPKLIAYLNTMRSLPFVASTRESSRTQARFSATRRAGHANADIE